MKNRKVILVYTVLILGLLGTFAIISIQATSKSKRVLYRFPREEYVPDEFASTPSNFAEYPSDFSGGTVPWDLDIIDAEPGKVSHDGEGIYIAVLDTGLVANWRDYFPEERIATEYGVGFYESVTYNKVKDEYKYGGKVHKGSFLGKLAHGTHVTSTIIGYSYYGQFVRGVAPKAKIIPVKVLDTYENLGGDVFGTDFMVAAGINYVADLAEQEGIKIVISMSIGGPEPALVIEEAIDYAISKGVIVVAAAGNSGLSFGWPADPTGAPTWFWIMDWPGGYPQVISVGSSGWGMGVNEDGSIKYPGTGEWEPWPQPSPRTWWYSNVPEDIEDEISYISYFSGREYVNPDFPTYTVELDVVAPGSWILGPYPGDTFGYQHIPWWAEGHPWNPHTPPPNYWYVSGTSMSTPHVSGIVALMLDKDPTLNQVAVETILKNSATDLPTMLPPNPFAYNYVRWPSGDIYAFLWDEYATGEGLVQADAVLGAIP
ncbi:S8 family serine peptidase [bacterium]|nr:S8 family serine peptidase [bacterium]